MADSARYATTFIRSWRQANGMSLDELAARVPMDKGNLSKLERGIHPYRQETVERIAEVLGVTVIALLSRDAGKPTPIWEYIDRATPLVRRQIEEAAAAIYRAGGSDE